MMSSIFLGIGGIAFVLILYQLYKIIEGRRSGR